MAKLEYDPITPLYTMDKKGWRLDEVGTVMTKLQNTGKPPVIFIHGRGKEPNKSLNGGTFVKGLAVSKIALGYDAAVLMFNWDSAFNGWNVFDREVSLSHAPAAADSLGQLLRGLKEFYASNKNATKPSLLIHSLGAVVAQRAMEKDLWPETTSLFSCVVLSQPDADDIGHAMWLEQLAKREKVYVTFNKDDHVLVRARDGRSSGIHSLGLGLTLRTSEPLATHAIYIDLSAMGAMGAKDDDHEVFGKGAMNGQIHVCQFFEQALTGKSVQLDKQINVENVERDVIFRLKNEKQPGAPCLKIPDLNGQESYS